MIIPEITLTGLGVAGIARSMSLDRGLRTFVRRPTSITESLGVINTNRVTRRLTVSSFVISSLVPRRTYSSLEACLLKQVSYLFRSTIVASPAESRQRT